MHSLAVIFCQHTCFHALKLYVFCTLKPEKVIQWFQENKFSSLICKYMEHGPPKSNQIIDSTGGKCGGSIKFPSCVVLDLLCLWECLNTHTQTDAHICHHDN